MAKRKTKNQRKSTAQKGAGKRTGQLTGLQRRFLAAYRVCGNITAAAERSKVDRTSHHAWLRKEGSSTYRQAFDAAQEEAIEHLESEARRRAEQGTSRPVFYQGTQCGVVQEYSDTLMIFLLKSLRPECYRDRHEIIHKSDEELDRELAAALGELATSGQGIAAGEDQGKTG